MYKITCDGKTLHDGNLQGLRVLDDQLTLELGKSGALEFVIYPQHPYYDSVKPLLSIVEVRRDELLLFRGRVLKIRYGFDNEKKVTCEGELAFLLDSVIPPDLYGGSFSSFLAYVVYTHNGQVEAAKQFAVGAVTVGDFSPYDITDMTEYRTAYDTLQRYMVEPSGGYLQVRHQYGTMHLDLIAPTADISNVSTQKIRLGKNLLDIKKEINGSEVFSVIVPLGAKVGNTENRLDISSVNGGSYSIEYAPAVAAYGKISKVVVFDTITSASELRAEALRYIADNFAAVNTIEITAADLADSTNGLDSYNVGQWVEMVSDMHFTEPQIFLIRKMTIKISDPAGTKIEAGRVKQGLTDTFGNVIDNIGSLAAQVQKVAGSISGAVAKATAAETKATSAETKATTAETKATAADTKATNAATAAANAQTTANTANTKATTATNTANSLSTRVQTLEGRPYVTGTGTTGIFTWTKYSDGTCEFFGKIPVSNYAITTALGNWYRGANLYETTTYAYPFTMTEAPAVEMTFQTRNGLAAIAWIFSADATTAQKYLPQCYLIRPVTGSGIYGNINIVGRGKLS